MANQKYEYWGEVFFPANSVPEGYFALWAGDGWRLHTFTLSSNRAQQDTDRAIVIWEREVGQGGGPGNSPQLTQGAAQFPGSPTRRKKKSAKKKKAARRT